MKVIGKMTSPTALANTIMQTERCTKATGRRTCNTGKAKRHGLMDLASREVIFMGKSMGKANLLGKMAQAMKVGSWMKIFRARAYTPGVMDKNMRDNTKMEKNTDWVL